MRLEGEQLYFTPEDAGKIFWGFAISNLATMSELSDSSHFVDELRDKFMQLPEQSTEEIHIVNIPPSRLFIARRLIRVYEQAQTPTPPAF